MFFKQVSSTLITLKIGKKSAFIQIFICHNKLQNKRHDVYARYHGNVLLLCKIRKSTQKIYTENEKQFFT